MAELYYAYTVFKGLRITPDLQLLFHPALAPQTAVGGSVHHLLHRPLLKPALAVAERVGVC